MRLCSRDHIWPARALWGHFEVDAEGIFLYFTAHTFSLIPLFFIFHFVLYSPSFYTPKFFWLHVCFFSMACKKDIVSTLWSILECDSIDFIQIPGLIVDYSSVQVISKKISVFTASRNQMGTKAAWLIVKRYWSRFKNPHNLIYKHCRL